MIAHYKYLFGFLSILVFSPLSSFCQTTVLLDDTSELRDIGRQAYYFEDSTLELSIEDILDDAIRNQFQVNSQETINFSSTASAYWLTFKAAKIKDGDFYLNLGSAYIDSISLYEFDDKDNLISTRHTGDDLPFSSREIEVGNYLFSLDIEPNTTHVFYLRVKSDQPLFFPLRVGTLPNFVAYEHDLDFLQGIYFGFMLLIFLYNLFLYFSTRERIYLYYIAYVFSITWFMASVFGYYFEYLWPNFPFLNQLVVASSGLTMITATLFTQKFLNTKETSPRMHKGSMLFLVIGFIVCLLVIFGLKIEGLKLSQGGLLIMAAYFLILGIRFKLKGYRPAKYYLLAWGALIIGIIFAILESLNLTFVMTYLNAMQIGSALEVVFLSFALGDRINVYKKEKEDAQVEALVSDKENERLIQEQNVLLEQKVKERTTELIQLNEQKDMLVDMVAHDLRTPLHQIKGIMWILDVPKIELPKEQKEYLSQIDNSVDRLSEMIGQILNTHGMEVNQINLKNEVIDLVDVVQYVAKSFQLTADEKNIKVMVRAEKGNHYAKVDKNYMIQVLENLLSNAIKFSEKGSHIMLHLNSKKGKTFISIEDNGPGISEQDQKKMFGRYQKLSAQPTAGESSIGLGLSIVKKFVEAMNGTIHCESELGKGTQFIITFNTEE